ncbi:MAG: C1 family peptidase [Pseudomonadota bacterium]
MSQEQKSESSDHSPQPSPLPPKLPLPPSWEDYWAHQVAEKAKTKVLGYFGVLAALVSILITLYGVNGIKTLLEDRFTKIVAEKEKEATARIERQLKEFEEEKLKSFGLQLEALEIEAKQKKEEYLAKLVLPPQYRETTPRGEIQSIDLSADAGAIRDQGAEGTTVGFTVAYALQAAIKKRDGKAVTLSARSIYVQAQKYDEWSGEDYEGSSVEGALKAVKASGAYLESDWPYSSKTAPSLNAKPSYKIADYTALKGIPEIKAALLGGKVIMVSIYITNDFDRPDSKGRVVIKPPIKIIGGHSLSIVGYNSGTAEFKFSNMWGTGWGERGVGYIRDVDLQKILDSAYTLKL